MSIQRRIEKAEKALQLTDEPVVVQIVMFGDPALRQAIDQLPVRDWL